MNKTHTTKATWSESEKEEMLTNHVRFEALRFLETVELWDRGAEAALQWVGVTDARAIVRANPMKARELNGMLRESCLLHFRSLLDFFFPRSSAKNDDVFAIDFVQSFATEEPDWLPECRALLDASLAHLTTKRLRFKPRPSWNKEPLSHVKDLVDAFVAALPEQQKGVFLAGDPL